MGHDSSQALRLRSKTLKHERQTTAIPLRQPKVATMDQPTVGPDAASLYDMGKSYIRCLQQYSLQFPQAIYAYQQLQANGAVRNALMGLPDPATNGGISAALPAVLLFHCTLRVQGNQSSFFITEEPKAKRGKKDKNSLRKMRHEQRTAAVKNIFQDLAVADYCSANFRHISRHELFSEHTFLVAVVGEHALELGNEEFTMSTIFSRLQIIEDKIAEGYKVDKRSKSEIGRLWIPSDSKELLLSLEEKWQSCFIAEVTDGTNQFLDQAAGIHIPDGKGQPQRRNEEETKAQGTTLRFPPENTSLGGVLEWSRQCFSPSFIEYFRKEAMASLRFMLDPTNPNSCRFVRCESPMATSQTDVYFQMGKPPNAALFRAVNSSKFGDMILQICNHVEAKRFKFFHESLAKVYGQKYADDTTPKKKDYDLLFIVLGSRSFSYHSDSRNMLFDDNVSGWEETMLRVVTIFFQNNTDADVSLSYRPRYRTDEGNFPEIKLSLAANGLHEQGNFVQPNTEHRPVEAAGRSADFRRCAFTARMTIPLQGQGLKVLRQQQARIPVFGSIPSDYNIPGDRLFEGGERSTEASMSTESGCDVGKRATQWLEEPQNCEEINQDKTTGPIPKKTLLLFGKRGGVFSYYRKKPQWKLLKESRPLPEMLCTGKGQRLLFDSKIRLSVVATNGSTFDFAPLTDQNKFVRAGEWLVCNSVCQKLGLKPRGDGYPPWHTQVQLLNSVHVSMRYKSSLEDQADGRSPALEVHRLMNGKERHGFSIFLSGGSATSPNDFSATIDRPVVECGGTLGVAFNMPCDQDPHSAINKALTKAARCRRIVAVIASHQHLPRQNRLDTNGNAMCMYLGMYMLTPVVECTPLSSKQIQMAESGVEARNLTDLDPIQREHLTFLTRTHYQCSLVPVIEPFEKELLSTWKPLRLSLKNPPSLVFPVPLTFSKEDFLEEEWVKRCSDTELLKRFVDNYDDNDGVDSHQYIATPKPRQFTMEEFVDVLRRLVIAHALRVMAINVDDSGSIASICDIPAKGKHHNRSDPFVSASRYWESVGCGTIPYLRSLGSNVQLHPYPCPLPSGDGKTLYLMESNRAEHPDYVSARLSRNGKAFLRENPILAGELFTQCFVTETLGNPTTNQVWWEEYKDSKGNVDGPLCGLPCNEETCVHFLDYLRKTTASKKGRLTDFLHGAYRIHEKLCQYETFDIALRNITRSASGFVQELIEATADWTGNPSKERQHTVERLAEFLCRTTHQTKDLFFASKILGSLEELVSGQPFGPVDEVPSGFGGKAGESLIVWMEASSSGASSDHWNELIREIERRYHEYGDDWWGYLTFDSQTGVLRNTINGRELNAHDCEHCTCKLYLFREHEPGGGRILSAKSRHDLSNSFPFRGLTFPTMEAIASIAIDKFKTEYVQQGVCYIPFADTRLDMVAASMTQLEEGLQTRNHRERDVVYINGRVLDKPKRLPKHAYYRRIFACEEACNTQIGERELVCSGRQVFKMRILEDANYGIALDEVRYYGDHVNMDGIPMADGKAAGVPNVDSLPVVEMAREIEDILSSSSIPGMVKFSNSFTLHTGSPNQKESAFWFHTDKEFTQGRVMFVPVQGQSFVFVSAPDIGLHRMDDCASEFKEWKSSLPTKQREAVDNFVKDFKAYAADHGQGRVYIYRLYPGTALCFDANNLIHGSIIPQQEKGVQRQLLIFHPLDVFVGMPDP